MVYASVNAIIRGALPLDIYIATKQNKTAWKGNSQAASEVEMGESRTPRPNKPIIECTTGLVDVFSLRFGLPSTGFLSAGPLVLNDD